MDELKKLTKAQKRALKVFADLDAPTNQEFADAMNLSYTAARAMRIALIKSGHVTDTPGKARSAKLTPAGIRYIQGGLR